MIDPVLLKDYLDDVRAKLERRGISLHTELELLTRLNAERRDILPLLENTRRARKEVGAKIAQAKSDGQSIEEYLKTGQQHSDQIQKQEEKLEQVEIQRHELLLSLPNLPHETVPEGTTAKDNQEIRRHGDPPKFDFLPKAHWDLGPALGILDFERAAKISRSRFAVLIGPGARLERALIDFMLNLHTRDHGYTEIAPPFLSNSKALTSTGNLPKFEDDLFKVTGDWDLYLIPTAEVPLCNLHAGEILNGELLPIKYTAYTPCFRSEAGSYGKDVRGLIRQHQFDKVEMVAYT